MEYYWLIAGAAQISLTCIKRSWWRRYFPPYSLFPHRRKNRKTLLLFPWKMFRWAPYFSPSSSDLYMLLPRSRITDAKRKFHNDNCLSKTTILQNRLRRGCFHEHYNLNLFKSRANRYLSPLHSSCLLPTIFSSIHITHIICHYHSNIYSLPWVLLGAYTERSLLF